MPRLCLRAWVHKFKGNSYNWIYQFRKSGLKSLNLSPDYSFTDKRLQLCEKIASYPLRVKLFIVKNLSKRCFLSKKIVCFFGSFLIEKFPSKRLSGHTTIWDFFGNISVRIAKVLWWNKSESVNYPSLSSSGKFWISKCLFWTLFQISRLRTFW